MFGMGDDSIQSMFDSQMSSFRTTLIGLYRQKAAASADRETMRFRYLTGMKAQFLNIVSDMMSDMFNDKDPAGQQLVTLVITFIESKIAMSNLDNTVIAGWGQAPARLGGRLNLSYFSPTSHIISEPFNALTSPNQDPAYKLYPSTFGPTSQSVDYYVNSNFVFGTVGQMSRAYIGGTGAIQFTMPPSLDWVTAFVKSKALPALASKYDYLVAKFSKDYPAGNLITTMNDFLDLYKNFIQQTKLVVQIQLSIDVAEKNLSSFVANYKDYVGSATFADIIAQIHAAAEASDIQPPPPAPQAVSDSVVSEAVAPIPPPAVVESKSKMPLLAAAAVGIFMLMNKGKS